MSVINHTPFPAIAFRQYNLAGEMNGVVAVRGTFGLRENAPMLIAEKQHPLVLSDIYGDDPHKSPLIAQSDLVPFKPGTDVTFQGSTFPPGGRAATSWWCGLKVGPVEKRLQVYGPRYWEPFLHGPKIMDWTLTEPSPATEVPVDWRLAWGGPIPGPADQPGDVCHFNPLGRGIVNLEHCDRHMRVPAPQLEDPKDPISKWNREYVPQGMGAVSSWWRQRQQYAGTYDEQWQNVRHPLLPKDFDYRFYQAAPPDQVATPWLSGDEYIELVHLTQVKPRVLTRLPGIRLRMRLLRDDGYFYADLVLDGIHIVIRRGLIGAFLTWRTGFPWPDGKGMPELAIVRSQLSEVAA